MGGQIDLWMKGRFPPSQTGDLIIQTGHFLLPYKHSERKTFLCLYVMVFACERLQCQCVRLFLPLLFDILKEKPNGV